MEVSLNNNDNDNNNNNNNNNYKDVLKPFPKKNK